MEAVSTSPGAGLDPGAAALRYLEAGGGDLESGAALAVYCLGAETCYVAVLREAGDRWLIASERKAEIGSREFDALLLAYESGRHRDADPEFWDRVDNPAGPEDEGLRAGLIEEIKRARERLSDEDETVVAIPGAALELSLSRAELEARIRELVEQTAHLVEEVLNDASLGAGDLSGLLLAGEAARAPLVAAELTRRFEAGAVFSAGPLPYREGGPEAEPESEAEPGRRRLLARSGVLAAALAVLVAAGAAFGTQLGDHEPPQSQDESAGAAPGGVDRSASGGGNSAEPTESASGGSGGSESPSPEDDGEPVSEPDSPEAEPPSADQDESPSEAPPEGEVPELVGMDAAAAGDDLSAAGFTEVEYEVDQRSFFDFSHDNCEVVDQDPAPGTVRPYGETITVTYSHTSSDGSGCFE